MLYFISTITYYRFVCCLLFCLFLFNIHCFDFCFIMYNISLYLELYLFVPFLYWTLINSVFPTTSMENLVIINQDFLF